MKITREREDVLSLRQTKQLTRGILMNARKEKETVE